MNNCREGNQWTTPCVWFGERQAWWFTGDGEKDEEQTCWKGIWVTWKRFLLHQFLCFYVSKSSPLGSGCKSLKQGFLWLSSARRSSNILRELRVQLQNKVTRGGWGTYINASRRRPLGSVPGLTGGIILYIPSGLGDNVESSSRAWRCCWGGL